MRVVPRNEVHMQTLRKLEADFPDVSNLYSTILAEKPITQIWNMIAIFYCINVFSYRWVVHHLIMRRQLLRIRGLWDTITCYYPPCYYQGVNPKVPAIIYKNNMYTLICEMKQRVGLEFTGISSYSSILKKTCYFQLYLHHLKSLWAFV